MPRHPSQPPLKSGCPPDNMSASSRHPGLTLVGVVLGHLVTRSDSGDCKGHNPPHRGDNLRCGDRKVGDSWGGDKKPPGC
jgi:hypothetical protein